MATRSSDRKWKKFRWCIISRNKSRVKTYPSESEPPPRNRSFRYPAPRNTLRYVLPVFAERFTFSRQLQSSIIKRRLKRETEFAVIDTAEGRRRVYLGPRTRNKRDLNTRVRRSFFAESNAVHNAIAFTAIQLRNYGTVLH